MPDSPGSRLEKYTLQRKSEVLMVELQTASGEEDIVTVYAGFSSSLMRSTAFDPDVPIIAADSQIISIDRLASPYNQDNPQYIASGLTWTEMEHILRQMNI